MSFFVVVPETPVITIDPTPVEDGQTFIVRCITASILDDFTIVFYEGSTELAPQDSIELQRVANISSASNYTCKVSTDNLITNSSVSKPEMPTSKSTWFSFKTFLCFLGSHFSSSTFHRFSFLSKIVCKLTYITSVAENLNQKRSMYVCVTKFKVIVINNLSKRFLCNFVCSECIPFKTNMCQ